MCGIKPSSRLKANGKGKEGREGCKKEGREGKKEKEIITRIIVLKRKSFLWKSIEVMKKDSC